MILVTGGTGLVGSHLLLKLVQSGLDVRATYRKNRRLEKAKRTLARYTEQATELFEKIDWVEADINDLPALEKAFEGVTHVYHCAALISFDPKSYRKLRKANIKGTANVVNLCLANSVEKLCYTSTIGTIGKSLNESMATEETEWTEADGNVYALTKKGAEMEVWRGSQEGLKVVIVNPGIIIGPTDWNQGSGKLFATANQGYSYYPPGGTGFVSINDVVRMMIQLMESSITNERYIAVAENLSYQEILSAIAKALGKNPPKKRLRIWQLKTFRFVDWAWCAISGNKRSMTKSTVRSLMNRQIFDNQKIKTDLNFEFDNISESIEFTANCFLADHS